MASGSAARQQQYDRQERQPVTQNRPAKEPKTHKKLLITNMDYTIYLVVAILTFVGIVMVFSASYLTAVTNSRFNNDPFYFLKLTSRWAVVGFISMNIMTMLPYQIIKKFAYLFFVVILILLVLVQIIGFAAGGATRGFENIPFFQTFQPQELAKAAIVFFIARQVADKPEILHNTKGFLFCCGAVLLIAGLVARGSLSAAIITAVIGFGLIFIASPHIWRFIVIGAAGGSGVVGYLWYIAHNPVMGADGAWRGERFLAWLDPFAYPLGKGLQIINSLYAIASGGLFGLGIGQSRQTPFLPLTYNDMIFAIICEELGLVGAAVVLLLFGIFIWRGMRVAVNAPDTFGSMTAAGIVLVIATQLIINVGVVTNVIPNTGVTMPFISYGGTSLLVCMTLSGILLNISRHTKE
jgi:cell division protein FtsW